MDVERDRGAAGTRGIDEALPWLLERAAREPAAIGFGDAVDSMEGRVDRNLDSYPIYDDD